MEQFLDERCPEPEIRQQVERLLSMDGNDEFLASPPHQFVGDAGQRGLEVEHWVTDMKRTWIGDSNLDGKFNSGDLIEAFSGGKYETGQDASWSQGDWDGDSVFGSGDLVFAFRDGGYE